MTQKDKKKEAMSNLLNGLTKPSSVVQPEEQEEIPTEPSPTTQNKRRRGRPPRSSQYHPRNIVIRDDLYEKARIIAMRYGITIKDITEKFFLDKISAYENKQGVIKISKSSKIDLDSF